MTKVTVDGKEYVSAVKGNRRIVVLDRGFIFVGDLRKENEMYILSDAYNVRSWKSGGFGGMETDPKASQVKLDKCADKIFKIGSEIFFTPVEDNWGL